MTGRAPCRETTSTPGPGTPSNGVCLHSRVVWSKDTGMRTLLPTALAVLLMASSSPLLSAEGSADEEKVYPMPEFRVESLDGTVFDSQELRGNVVLLDLWATWCAPCLTAAPALDKLYEDFKGRGLVMMGIAVDSGTEENVRKAIRDFGMSYPTVMWNEHLAERIQGVEAVPTYIVVAPDWTVHKLFVGATSPRRLRKAVEDLLGPTDDGAASR